MSGWRISEEIIREATEEPWKDKVREIKKDKMSKSTIQSKILNDEMQRQTKLE